MRLFVAVLCVWAVSAQEKEDPNLVNDPRQGRFFSQNQDFFGGFARMPFPSHPLDLIFGGFPQPSGGGGADQVSGSGFDGRGRPNAVFVDVNQRQGLTPFRGGGSVFQDGGLFNAPAYEPWWKGPNVCHSMKDTEADPNEGTPLIFALHSKQCQELPDSYICTTKVRTHNESKTIVDKYVCCHGYQRNPNGIGCHEVKLKDVQDTLKAIGATKFNELSSEVEITKRGGPQENVTIFSPTNEALKESEDANEVKTENQKDMVNAHMVRGLYPIADLQDEMKLPTVDGKSSIRFNEFFNPDKIITANCVPIVSTNNMAQNGVIHLVDGTLEAPTKTLRQLLAENSNYSIFNEMLSHSELQNKLDEADGHLTVLAPTNAAFEKLDKDTVDRWRRGEACIEKLLEGHILPHVICTTAVPRTARVRNLNGISVALRRNPDDSIVAEGTSKLVEKDKMATNGVLHAIDEVMTTQHNKQLIESLKEAKMTDLVHLLESNQLADKLNNLKNFTFFAPTEDALKQISLKEWEELKSKGELSQMLMYHTVGQKLSPKDFFNNMISSSELPESSLRFNVYSRANFFDRPTVTVQCARILTAAHAVCGGNVYLVDKVLKKPYPNVMEALDQPEFSIFKKLVQRAGLESQLKNNAGPFTVLAPSDEAFKKITKKEMERIEEGRDLENLVKQHVLPEMVCTSGVQHQGYFYTQDYRALDGKPVNTQRTLRGGVYFAGARVAKGDIAAANGVVHEMDRVIGLESERGIQNRQGNNGFNQDFPGGFFK